MATSSGPRRLLSEATEAELEDEPEDAEEPEENDALCELLLEALLADFDDEPADEGDPPAEALDWFSCCDPPAVML